MSFNKITFLFIILVLVLGCKPRNSEKSQNKIQQETKSEISGTFSISGSDALYPLVRKWADDFMRFHAGIKIAVTDGGTGKGIEDLKDKKSQLAMISRPLNDVELETGVWTVPVAKDGVAAIINMKNPYFKRILDRGLSPEEFYKVFINEKPVTWGELLDTTGKEKVEVFTRADESGAAVVFAGFLNKESKDLKGTGVNGDAEMIKSIQMHPYSIGYCNFSYAFDPSTGDRAKDIQIVPADLDYNNKISRKEIPFSNLEKAHRGLWLGLYPKVLCRELSIGSLGKPNDAAVVGFLKFILSDGQNDIKASGLCELNDVYVRYSLENLK